MTALDSKFDSYSPEPYNGEYGDASLIDVRTVRCVEIEGLVLDGNGNLRLTGSNARRLAVRLIVEAEESDGSGLPLPADVRRMLLES